MGCSVLGHLTPRLLRSRSPESNPTEPAKGNPLKILVCTLAFLLLFSAAGLRAQTTNGSIQGTVTDPSGAPVGGASVTARNLDTGLTVATVTSDAGLYSLANLPPGRYSVTVEGPNMKNYVREGVTVQTGSTVSLDIQMQLGGVSENVTVSADASQLETATSDT